MSLIDRNIQSSFFIAIDIGGLEIAAEPFFKSFVQSTEHLPNVPGEISKLAPLGDVGLFAFNFLDELFHQGELPRVRKAQMFLALVRRLFQPVFSADSHN